MLRQILLLLLLATPSVAQNQLSPPQIPGSRTPSHCIALARNTPGIEYLHKASFGTGLAPDAVRIHYVAHATFTLETPGGLLAATDYTGFLGTADVIPDVVTMNIAHDTHRTDSPDPRIPHVLQGWPTPSGPADHRLDLGAMLVRNVTTDLRNDMGGRHEDANSIFIFETAGLCIGHLGHLHHEPTPEQYATIGRLDVVMVPVDGGYTMSLPDMARVMRRLRSSVVLPMHWFSGTSLAMFLSDLGPEFDVVRLDQPDITLSLATLPSRPTIMVLRPGWLR